MYCAVMCILFLYRTAKSCAYLKYLYRHMRVMDLIKGQIVRVALAMNEDQHVSHIQIVLFELPTRTLSFL
jgi:hypothetical protein